MSCVVLFRIAQTTKATVLSMTAVVDKRRSSKFQNLLLDQQEWVSTNTNL